ncbi:serine/threonine protein kinase [Rhodopirellula islandica]|uniref:Serine/threonine protein kinase n=2 Tax=Rhodopirellula islandica TaxID=595434 RepID=A0A0J1EAG5_RHOIS|nr:serine/threonine protein kinase [Rhodopirellula islandica]
MSALADTMELPADYSNPLATSRPMKFTHSPNDLVLDRYTIRRGIGVGGFGEVYFAVSQAGKEVALKRIQRNLEVELRGVSHCLNLKHLNLVSLHDVCRDADDQAWVVMEYVAGPNLREVMDEAAKSAESDSRNVLPSGLFESQVRHWFAGASAGVAHLHSAGLVHRDIKPGNLFDDNGIVKVGDYGLSKFISASHRSGHTESIGTFHYMAPEIGRGQYGREIDLYALGVILFEMLTGELPFDGETPQEIIVKHLTDSPDLSRVPNPYRNVIHRCLQKDPSKRPRDVAEMLSLASMPSDQTPVLAEVVTSESKPFDSDSSRFQSKKRRHADPVIAAGLASPHAGGASMVLNSSAGEEPIARAVRNSFSDARAWWRALETSPGIKLVLAVSAVAILLINTHWLLPVLSMVGFFYVPYYVIRHVVLQLSDPTSYSPTSTDSQGLRQGGPHAHAVANVRPAVKPTMTKAQVRSLLRTSLSDRTRLSRSAEWATSGMTSMIVAGVLLLLSSVIGMRSTPFTPMALAPYVWMALVIWLGAFGLLGIGKFWEGSDGEGLVRRLVSSSWGACLGLLAFVLGHFLMVPMDEGLGRDIDATALPVSFYLESGVPKAAAMMGHFALLFALLRMWKPVDPLRRVRLSLWAVTVAVVGEWVVHQIVPVPQPAGMLIAGGVIVMTQLSAPWVKADAISTV